MLSSARVPCYSRGMKRDKGKSGSCQVCPASGKESHIRANILCTAVLLGLGFFPFPGNRRTPQHQRAMEFVAAAYGIEIQAAEPAPHPEQQLSTEQVAPEQDFPERTEPLFLQENRTMSSTTCGHSWKAPLVEISGKIENIAYRVQPVTGRKGLHLDVETSPLNYVVIHVYPEMLIAQCPSAFHFTVGETVMITGSQFFTGTGEKQQNICAATITRGEEVFDIRDPETGDLDRQLCCREICTRNCVGMPPVCRRMCMQNCGSKRMQAVFQPLSFCPACDQVYTATATVDR